MSKPPASIDPVPTPLAVRWPRTGRSVPHARLHLRAALVRWELADLVETAELVLSELLTNAGAPRGALLYPRSNREELEGCSWV